MKRTDFLAQVLGGLMALVGVRKAEPFRQGLGFEITPELSAKMRGTSPETAEAAIKRYWETMGTVRFDAEARVLDTLPPADDLPGNRFIVEIEP